MTHQESFRSTVGDRAVDADTSSAAGFRELPTPYLLTCKNRIKTRIKSER
jgi:hypothetical protein